MKSLLFIFVVAMLTTGCASLLQATDKVAEKLADAKQEYCAETDANARQQIRDAYNAEMDARGLPQDQINCPE